MTPNAAAEAFYGLDEAEFAAQVARISVNDRRLEVLFHKTRERYLASRNNNCSRAAGPMIA